MIRQETLVELRRKRPFVKEVRLLQPVTLLSLQCLYWQLHDRARQRQQLLAQQHLHPTQVLAALPVLLLCATQVQAPTIRCPLGKPRVTMLAR
jgi:hypothetical protein